MTSLTAVLCLKAQLCQKDRSLMNVPFVTGDKEMDAKFVKRLQPQAW